MLDFATVSIEWGALLVQLFCILLLIALLLIVAICFKRLSSQARVRQAAIEALEKRVAALEKERDRP